MMKKMFFGALGLLTLASCSNDELIEVNRDGDEITFNVVTNSTSRANDVYCNNNKPEQFTVWATYNGKQYIDGDIIKDESGTWTNSTGNRYWPSPDGEVTFYAFYNDDSNFKYKDNSDQIAPHINGFKVKENVNEQTDLIYAVKKQAKSTNTQVSLNFRHALSQIVFQAKNTNQNLYVEIDGVSICKVKNTGTFTFPSEDTDTNKENHNGTTTTINHDDTWGKWGTLSGSHNYSVSFDKVAVNGNSSVVSLTNTNDKPGSDANKYEFSSKAMLLLPQKSDAWDVVGSSSVKPKEQSNTYFLVDCVIYNVAGENVNKATDVCLWGKAPTATGGEYTTKSVAIPVKLDWAQGQKYIYTFVFGDGNGGYDPEGPTPVLVPITFNVTVDDFEPVADKDIPMEEPKPESSAS